ncbi:MAG: hypothetical protein MUC77_06615 [Chromatiaceae bacterium]|nr:hypothetical protein [Chromatiaceae bacterium]
MAPVVTLSHPPFSRFLPLLALALLVGCASAPTSQTGREPIPELDPSAPRVLLAGATPEQARSLAMGAAASKGWRLSESADTLLVMQRPLNPAVAESAVPGASQGPKPAQVEVRTLFLPRADGTEVALQADMLTSDTKGEVRHPFTDRYRPELERSLASLRRSWEGANWRVAGAAPPLPEPPPPAPLDTDSDTSAEGTASATPAQPAEQAAIAAPVQPIPPPQPPSPARPSAAPVTSATTTRAPAPVVAASPDPASSNMLKLSTAPSATGVWAYYAEHYARVRGCRLAGDGAVLLRKTPEYEEHRVYCEGGQTFQVRCNAGVCRGLE